jgi:membrane protein
MGRGALAIVKQAFADWRQDNAGRLGAALSYYTLFSLAPLLIVAIALAGFFFGREAAQGQIVAQIQGLVGDAGARAVQGMIENSRQPAAGLLATIIGVVTLLLGATGAFAELKGALNVVWDVEDEGGGLLALLRGRLWAFAMVLAVGFLLMVSLLISAAVAAADGFLEWIGIPSAQVQLLNASSSFLVITVLFALLFKFLPDTEVAWRDVWLGALITSALFTVGKLLIGLYLGRSSVASAYGAAGSVVVLILWVYYAAQIFFFGAEVTQAYAHRQGSRQERKALVPEPA